VERPGLLPAAFRKCSNFRAVIQYRVGEAVGILRAGAPGAIFSVDFRAKWESDDFYHRSSLGISSVTEGVVLPPDQGEHHGPNSAPPSSAY
jgi:hypothetical protein